MIPQKNLFLAFTLIAIIIIILLNQNEKGVITGIVMAILYILFSQFYIHNHMKQKFANNFTDQTLNDDLTPAELAKSQEIPSDAKTYCSGNTSDYKGAIDCDEEEAVIPFSGDIDSKVAQQSLGRNDYVRAMTGVIDRKTEMNKYLKEEIDDAENERWFADVT
jgi:hypothetical protein